MNRKWIDSAGGPLILLGRRLLPEWSGFAPHSRSVQRAMPATDYERACAVDDYLGVISVGAGQTLVIGGEPLSTCWIVPSGPFDGMLVRWVCADDQEAMDSAINTVRARRSAVICSVLFDAFDEEHFMFDSAIPGCDLKDIEVVVVSLTPARYSVETELYNGGERTSLIAHRFCRIHHALGK